MDVQVDVPAPAQTAAEALERLEQVLITKAAADSTRLKIEGLLAESTQTLKDALFAGMSTGDAVKDLVIMAGHGLDKALLKACQELQDALKGCKGELVLVNYTIVEEGLTERRKRRVLIHRFAKLSSETLALCKSDAPLEPMGPNYFLSLETIGGFVDARHTWYPRNCVVDLGNPESGALFDRGWKRRYGPPGLAQLLCPEHDDRHWSERVVIGNNAVATYLELGDNMGLYDAALKALQLPSKQTPAA